MKKASIGTIATVSIIFLALKGLTYYKQVQYWKKKKIQQVYYNSLDEKDIAWG